MTNQLTPLQCPGCGGLLRSLDARVWQCSYCESRYMLLGEETPVPGLARVVDERDPEHSKGLYFYGDCWPGTRQDLDGVLHVQEPLSELQIAKIKARTAIDDFGYKFGKTKTVIPTYQAPTCRFPTSRQRAIWWTYDRPGATAHRQR